jgi:hypothetical protein
MDFTASRTIVRPSQLIKFVNLQVGLTYVLGKHAVTDVLSGTVSTYNFLAGRNLFIAANVRFYFFMICRSKKFRLTATAAIP